VTKTNHWTVCDVHSRLSACWDLVQAILLVYVCIAVPYQVGFNILAPIYSWLWFWELTIDVYFVLDILRNFRTPYYNAQGKMETSSRKMAKNYLRTWFTIDICSCVSMIQYLYLILDSDPGQVGSTKVARVVRLVRMAKLLRLARMTRIMDRLPDNVMKVLEPMLALLGLILGMTFMLHLVSCFWYAAGSTTTEYVKDGKLVVVNGWVENTYGSNSTDDSDSSIQRYVTSLYSIMLAEFQLNPTLPEKIFALITIIINGFICKYLPTLLLCPALMAEPLCRS
jgi:hypothetical protein